MLDFRHGRALYLYCVECQHGNFTPITKVLGCEVGDHPEVVDYSDRYTTDPTIAETEKCPGFEPRQEIGVTATVPGDAQNNDAEDLYGMMEGGRLEDIEDENERHIAMVRILQSWRGGCLAITAHTISDVNTIYQGYLSWRKSR